MRMSEGFGYQDSYLRGHTAHGDLFTPIIILQLKQSRRSKILTNSWTKEQLKKLIMSGQAWRSPLSATDIG